MVLAISGPRRVDAAANERQNVGEVERLLSIAGGSALAITGLRRRGIGGAVLALLGAELVRRGATGRCMLYETLGISTAHDGHALATHRPPGDLAGLAATVDAREAIKVERTVFVERPRGELYAFWRDFRNHPRFTRHLQSVDVDGDGSSRWVMSLPGGRTLEWRSVMVNDIPNELVAWKTTLDSGVAHAGSVHFTDAVGGGTHVRLVMDYEPPGGRPGYALSRILGLSADQIVEDDLERFKELMEQEGFRAPNRAG